MCITHQQRYVDFAHYFNSILTKGKKDNTYKFALARFLIEYSYEQNLSDIENKIGTNEMTTIKYSVIAESGIIGIRYVNIK